MSSSIEQKGGDIQELHFSGISASRGIAIGPAFFYARTHLFAEDRPLEAGELESELGRFEAAVKKARAELEKIRTIAEQKVGAQTSSIFEAQMMMVCDPILLETIRKRMQDDQKSAAFVVETEFSKQQRLLQQSDNALMRERADDIEDIKQRLLRNLMDKEKWQSKIDRPSIIVAKSLTPADAILFSRTNVLGYVIDTGGVTGHAAILARSLGIPALVAMHNVSEKIRTGDQLILDGERGELVLFPTEQTLSNYQREVESPIGVPDHSTDASTEPLTDLFELDLPGVRTRDKRAVTIAMNLEFGSEAAIVEAARVSRVLSPRPDAPCIGLGLVRTEHFLMLNEEFPTEEEQNALYTDLAHQFFPESITIRTFDVGGDKVLAGSYHEDNPFLGWRGLRISLDEPDIFLAQVRAALRASSRKNVKLMFPMVTNVDELERAISFVEQAKEELRVRLEPFDENIPIGIMVEVPAAALMATAFAPLVDFFSIGTNDLTQYTLAVDRGNDLIAGLYQELHPAVLRLIKLTVDAAHIMSKTVSICGELGSYPLATPVLVGLGVDEISVAPMQVRALAARIRSVTFEECERLTAGILAECDSPASVKHHILSFLHDRHLIEPFEGEQPRSAFGSKLMRR
jgi:phosphotransferase system enzyme I (PtsI)